ncbi:hypothetical protein EVAR_52772_1 [Eumeta japonica]|uniref:Uncharacterized protein n=1 Tax=Eumeta variegata TaxID=151549 RepID=A0A4C1XDK7_EUMVA|nr:hypothetical protein EVAR_52772_1 [Eumeta japonica]
MLLADLFLVSIHRGASHRFFQYLSRLQNPTATTLTSAVRRCDGSWRSALRSRINPLLTWPWSGKRLNRGCTAGRATCGSSPLGAASAVFRQRGAKHLRYLIDSPINVRAASLRSRPTSHSSERQLLRMRQTERLLLPLVTSLIQREVLPIWYVSGIANGRVTVTVTTSDRIGEKTSQIDLICYIVADAKVHLVANYQVNRSRSDRIKPTTLSSSKPFEICQLVHVSVDAYYVDCTLNPNSIVAFSIVVVDAVKRKLLKFSA